MDSFSVTFKALAGLGVTMPGQKTGADLEFPSNWRNDETGKRVETEVQTKDFVTAVALIRQIAEIAEDEGHHPDLHLTGYNGLRIVSSSHDVGGLTDRDARLVKRLESLLRDEGLRGG